MAPYGIFTLSQEKAVQLTNDISAPTWQGSDWIPRAPSHLSLP